MLARRCVRKLNVVMVAEAYTEVDADLPFSTNYAGGSCTINVIEVL